LKFLGLAARNLLRNKVRTALTVAGVAIALVAFLLIQTTIGAWEIGVTLAAKDRLVSRHKVTFTMTVPKRYVEEVRQTPGVKDATFSTWWGGKNPNAEKDFFMTLAVEPETFLDVFDEVGITPEEKAAWIADRQGVIVGDILATKFKWKVGDEVSLVSAIYPGEWKFRVKAIYKPLRKSAGRDWFLFDWDYLNENAPERMREQIGWITARVQPGLSAADVSKTIDAHFDVQDIQTSTQDEGAFNQSFLGMFTTILRALNIVSFVILGIMMLILGNTVAMGVRERTREYGVLRAVGFLPGHITFLVLAEAATLGLLGGLAGLAIGIPVIGGMGAFIEENMSAFFPVFRLPALISLLAVGIAILLGLVSAAVPAFSAKRLKVVEALRHTA
jgi:putative ABC transport system permease protein